MSSRKIVFVTYNERPNSGLFNSQVLSLLIELGLREDDNEITLTSFWLPWIFLANRKRLKQIKGLLGRNNVKFRSIPLALPARYFHSNRFLLTLNILYIKNIFVLFGLNKFDIIHGRGYFISYVAALFAKKVRVIFDMRSLFPEENITAGTWKRSSAIFRKWKQMEEFIIRNSSYNVAVSKTMVGSLSENYPNCKVVNIPIGFQKDSTLPDDEDLKSLKRKIGLNDQFVFVYSGSLQLNFWNDLTLYVEYFKLLEKKVDNSFFLILTNSNHDIIVNKMKEASIFNFHVLSLSPNEVSRYLKLGDVGIQVMRATEDSDTRFGVKVIEYWSIGLPVVTNSNVGGVCEILSEYPYLGYIIDSEKDLEVLDLRREIIEKDLIIKYALDNYEFSSIANSYSDLYKSV